MSAYDFLSKALVTIEDFSQSLTKQKRSQLINSLIQDNRLRKIKNGLYASVNPITQDVFANKFEIATALHKDCWVSYHSALEFHGVGNQLYSEVQISCKQQHKAFEFGGLEYIFYTNQSIDGVMTLEQNATIRVTDLEKTVVDCLDRIDLAGGLEEIVTTFSGITYLDEKKLVRYLQNANKKVLFKKAGYLLSLCCNHLLSNEFFAFCKDNMGTRVDDITENKRLSQKMNSEWNLIVPTKLINTEN